MGETVNMEYNVTELMACVSSRLLEDNKAVLVGTGLPLVSASLAQNLHAPNLLVVFEAGGIGALIPTIPISVGDSRTCHRAVMAASMDYVMSCAQLGFTDYAFLGAAQIDQYGNLNTTVIGDYDVPKVRLPGSGGGNDAGSLCNKTIILMRHDKRRFVENLDFLTTPGYLTGSGAREKMGLPADTGPYRVISQLGVMDFEPITRRMRLISVHPGIKVEEVLENTSFELFVNEEVSMTEPPTQEELDLLRNEVDSAGIVIGKS
jgi:glutaconate CoA-transferase subunit B